MPLEPDDFTRLYRRHAQGLLVFFQRRVHEPELAADLLAETFELAIRGGPDFRGSSPSELSGWLWSIARNVLAEQARRTEGERARAARMGRTPVTLTDREIERIEELAGLAELREAVAQRLAELPAEQREAVRLRVLDDVPYVQIAGRMNTTVEVARARVSRGLRALNVALKDEHRAWRGQ
ncbi:MAG: sigma-70 family RNA polymerase sigma factor [Solirubrobacterales bacterium]|nr:sigma-70 family RNA polymerase sigma factor [Solirubrobacterales bacterium]